MSDEKELLPDGSQTENDAIEESPEAAQNSSHTPSSNNDKINKTLSPIYASGHSPIPTQNISVEGSYDQFARLPRKEKNAKYRSNSPKTDRQEGRSRSSQASDKLGSSKSNSSSRKSGFKSDTGVNDETANNQVEQESGVLNSEHESPNEKSKRLHNQSDVTRSVMSVTNLPWNESTEGSKHTLSRFDSLPPRKHAKIEQMKQTRVETSENKSSENAHFLARVEHKKKILASDIQGAIISHKISDNPAFTPPVASVVDFLETPEFHHRVAVVNKSFVDNIFRTGRIDPAVMSRLSAKYMVKYLGIGSEPRSKNVVSSMVVRPILPPIKRTNVNESEKYNFSEDKNLPAEVTTSDSVQTRLKVKSDKKRRPRRRIDYAPPGQNSVQEVNGEYSENEDNLEPAKDSADMTYHFRRGTRLRQGDSRYVYKPRAHHSTNVLGATTNSPKEVLEIGGEIEDDFDRVVRWKSKMRYCGKPAMYKRITSPTLGEEAIRRKLINRLPTRQIHKPWPESGDLYSESNDQSESWRRPNQLKSSSNLNSTISYNGAAFKTRQQRDTSLASSDQDHSVMYAASRHRLMGITLPPPQIPERKRRPMWQRM